MGNTGQNSEEQTPDMNADTKDQDHAISDVSDNTISKWARSYADCTPLKNLSLFAHVLRICMRQNLKMVD